MNNDQNNNKNIILFTAHPDDHLLCAGTLMYLSDKGFSITEVVFTGGEKSVWQGKKSFSKSKLKTKRSKELQEACEIIGIQESAMLGIPDSEIKREMGLIHKIMKIIRLKKPILVLTHNPYDYHHDHREIANLVTEAVDRASWSLAPELGEKHKTPLFLYFDGEYFGRADFILDISKYEDRLKILMDAYESQMSLGMKNLLNSIKTYHGFFARSKMAEGFEIGYRHSINLSEKLENFLRIFEYKSKNA